MVGSPADAADKARLNEKARRFSERLQNPLLRIPRRFARPYPVADSLACMFCAIIAVPLGVASAAVVSAFCNSRNVSTRIAVGSSEGAKQSVPEEVDDRKIRVGMQMMNEMKLLLAPEPGEASEPRLRCVVFLVEIHVRIERRRARSGRYQKQTEWQDKVHYPRDQNGRDQKIRCVVAVVSVMGGRHQAASGVVPMVELDMVSAERTAKPAMTKAVVEQGLAA